MRWGSTRLGSLLACSPARAPCRVGVNQRLATTCLARQASKRGAASAADEADDEFSATFREQWGPRWPALSAALAARTRHVALQNAFLRRPLDPSELPGAEPLAARQPALAGLLAATSSSGSSSSCGSSAAPPAVQALHWEPPGSDSSYPPPPADPASGLLTHYWLDAASLVPPLLLDVQPGQHVLDMCSAPGGKAFVLAQLLLAQEQAAAAAAAAVEGGSSEDENQTSSGDCGSQLVCNEIDAARRARLVRVIRDYVPVPVRYSIRVTPHDGARWWGRQEEAEAFDRVLLDAPCSSDRHVAQQAAARGGGCVTRADWSLARCRRVAQDQARLLAAGVKALRPGGRLVYSTCSILDAENDGVVQRVLDKAQGSLAVIAHTLQAPGASASAGAAAALAALDAAGAERTRHGWLLLPDATGCGPIYLAVLHKSASSELRRTKVNKYARE